MRKIIFLFLLISYIIFSGCGSQQQNISNEPLCMPNTSLEQAMLFSKSTLLKMHFDLEKYDTNAGYIRTRPLSGAQFFEFWRQDNTSFSAVAQANLHSLRRVVELDFTPEESKTCVQCRARVLRLSMPESPIEGTKQMSRVYTDGDSGYQSLEVDLDKRETVEWIDAGQDPDLERVILERIQHQIQKGTEQ